MAYKYKIFLFIAPAVLILDQFTKFLVLEYMAFGNVIPVIPGFFDWVHVRNTGAAFGMLSNLNESIRVPFFYAISFIAVVVLVYVFLHLDSEDRFYPYPLSLIAAGVAGNIIDRLRFGNVVDFISLHIQDKVVWGVRLDWPAFNVADSAITISMVLLAAHILKSSKSEIRNSK